MHAILVTIGYTPTTFSVVSLASIKLIYEQGMIHPTYDKDIGAHFDSISTSLGEARMRLSLLATVIGAAAILLAGCVEPDTELAQGDFGPKPDNQLLEQLIRTYHRERFLGSAELHSVRITAPPVRGYIESSSGSFRFGWIVCSQDVSKDFARDGKTLVSLPYVYVIRDSKIIFAHANWYRPIPGSRCERTQRVIPADSAPTPQAR